jgi:Fe-S cluster assembly protein SufD
LANRPGAVLEVPGEALRGLSREELRARYEALALPTTSEEAWRFTDLRGFDPDSYVSNGHGARTVPRARPDEAMLEIDASAVVTVGEAGLTIERAPDGVTVAPLADDHPRLGSLVGPADKLTAHNAAMWRNGLHVRVPRGIELEKPIYVRVANAVPDGVLFWRLLVEADDEARFTVIEEYASDSPDLPAYTNAAVELFVGRAAKLEYVSIQNLSRETWHFASHRARVDRDAELDWVTGAFGSKKGKVRIENDLAGPGATSRVTGAYFADGSQHLDYDTFQEHAAPSTTSDFAFKGALRDRATAVWRGMIRVEPDAQKTNAYQENRNLLLSERAHADSIPGLEIMANDVRCTHGATVGQVDREQLFYLMARGLSRAEAERLIVRGFFADILDRIELEPVRETLGAALEARIPAA